MDRLDLIIDRIVNGMSRDSKLTKGQISAARALGLKLRKIERETGQKVSISESEVSKILGEK